MEVSYGYRVEVVVVQVADSAANGDVTSVLSRASATWHMIEGGEDLTVDRCILRGPGEERILDIVPGGTELGHTLSIIPK